MKTYCCYCGAYLETLKGKAKYYFDKPCHDCNKELELIPYGPQRAMLYLIRKMLDRVHSS